MQAIVGTVRGRALAAGALVVVLAAAALWLTLGRGPSYSPAEKARACARVQQVLALEQVYTQDPVRAARANQAQRRIDVEDAQRLTAEFDC